MSIIVGSKKVSPYLQTYNIKTKNRYIYRHLSLRPKTNQSLLMIVFYSKEPSKINKLARKPIMQ